MTRKRDCSFSLIHRNHFFSCRSWFQRFCLSMWSFHHWTSFSSVCEPPFPVLFTETRKRRISLLFVFCDCRVLSRLFSRLKRPFHRFQGVHLKIWCEIIASETRDRYLIIDGECLHPVSFLDRVMLFVASVPFVFSLPHE